MFGSTLRIPIRLKLVGLFSLLILLFTFFNFSYYPKTYRSQALTNLNNHITTMSEMIALTSGISLEVLDLSIIASAINWAKQDSRLAYIGIFDENNEPVSTFNPGDISLDISETLKTKEIFEIGANFFIVTPIVYNKTKYGNIILGLSLSNFYENISKNETTTLYICLAMLLLGVMLSYFFSNKITRPLIQLTEAADNISQGKTDVDIDIHTRDEVGALCKNFKSMANNIRQSFDNQISSIVNTSKTLTTSSNEISAAILEQVGIAADQSTSISEISATLKQLATTSSQIADNSTKVVDTSSTAVTYSEKGVHALESLKERMDDITRDNEDNLMEIVELGRKSQEIGSVMEIISHIADQTKLIAFNAAIEAASAGETGKRFGVVAVEIRNLADNVMKSTLDIESRIEEVQASINKLVVSSENGTKKIKTVNDLAAQTLNQFEGLVNGARSANDAATTISFSTQQQEFATSQVFEALKEIEQGIHHYSASTQQTNSISQGLLILAEELNRLIEGLQNGSQNNNSSKHELQKIESSSN